MGSCISVVRKKVMFLNGSSSSKIRLCWKYNHLAIVYGPNLQISEIHLYCHQRSYSKDHRNRFDTSVLMTSKWSTLNSEFVGVTMWRLIFTSKRNIFNIFLSPFQYHESSLNRLWDRSKLTTISLNHRRHMLQIRLCLKIGQTWGKAIFWMDRGLSHLKKSYWNQPDTCYPLASKTRFTGSYAKPFVSTNSHQ
jgi:hypothetical protein